MEHATPRIAALVGKYQSPDVAESLRLLAAYLRDKGLTVLVEEDTAASVGAPGFPPASFERIGNDADLAIIVGGDGTFLSAARRLAPYRVPLVGVNQGRLGFMTDVAREHMLDGMEDLLAGRFVREERILLEAEVRRGGERVQRALALNDVVMSKGEMGRMIEFELHVDGEFIYVLRADGMIMATPTGSTAYALSANGPILHPAMGAIAVVPLCPHGLSYRPITISDGSVIELVLLNPHDAMVHFDGQVRCDARAGDRLVVRRAPETIAFLHPPGYSYFAMLREKLHWSAIPKRG